MAIYKPHLRREKKEIGAMIKSMTGFGSAKGSSGKLDITVELKSVNSRYFDCAIKIPRAYISFEEPLKSAVGQHISRGKVDVFITIDSSKAGDVEISVNRPLADAYVSALRSLERDYHLSGIFSATDLSRFPDILTANKKEEDPERLCADIRAILEEALAGFDEMRSAEGESLHSDIVSRLDEIEKLTATAEGISPKVVEDYRLKLETRLRDILQSTDIDEQRILTEAALFADRTAINEETVRLRSHVAQLRGLLEAGEPVGRKIDFLLQEFNREANTIGSKGNDAEMSRVTVDLKAEIEKIREQAQNIE